MKKLSQYPFPETLWSFTIMYLEKGSIAKKGKIIKLKLILFSFKNMKNIVKKKGIAFTKENKIKITDTRQYLDI